MKKVFLAIVLSITGCTLSLAQMERVSMRLTTESNFKVCREYGFFSRGASGVFFKEGYKQFASLYKTELEKRKLLTDRELVLVSRQKIALGMSRCALYASWGRPTRENRSVGSYGVHIQHIYGRGYVYTENGRIRSWQD